MATTVDQQEFLTLVFGEEPGKFEVLSLQGKKSRVGYPLNKPITGDDIYFRPVLFTPEGARRLTVVSDTDLEHPTLRSSVTVQTSDKRIWSGWRLNESINDGEERVLQRRLDPMTSHVDWVRMPGTFSTKRGAPYEVHVRETGGQYDLQELWNLPVPETCVEDIDESWLGWAPAGGAGPQQLLAGLNKSALGRQLTIEVPLDRFIRRMLAGGLEPEVIIYLALAAKCNPFKDLTYGASREIAKAILRLRASATSKSSQILEEINTLRLSRNSRGFKNRDRIADLVIQDLETRGPLLNTQQEVPWFVDQTSGQSYLLSERSEGIRYLINRRYGLNPVDGEHRHTVISLISHVKALPAKAIQTSLSYADENRVLFNFGGKEVLSVSARSVGTEANGSSGTIFKASRETVPTDLDPNKVVFDPAWWYEFCPPLISVTSLEEKQARDLLHVWLVFVLMRNLARERPILAFTGSMGSGKSTLLRRIFYLLFGIGCELQIVRGEEDFNVTLLTHALAILDNLDQVASPSWLTNRLEQATIPMSFSKRALWTNADEFFMRFDSCIGFTAADPSFLRGALIDRLLVLNFKRVGDKERIGAKEMLDLKGQRLKWLGNLMGDIQKVYQTPRPRVDEAHFGFRIADFNYLGLWIARALNVEAAFIECLRRTEIRQVTMTTEMDQVLIDALEQWSDQTRNEEWITATRLWDELHDASLDQTTFTTRYKTSMVLGKKLLSIYPHLSKLLPQLETKEDERTGWHLWRMLKK